MARPAPQMHPQPDHFKRLLDAKQLLHMHHAPVCALEYGVGGRHGEGLEEGPGDCVSMCVCAGPGFIKKEVPHTSSDKCLTPFFALSKQGCGFIRGLGRPGCVRYCRALGVTPVR